jgi:hypothetical protein
MARRLALIDGRLKFAIQSSPQDSLNPRISCWEAGHMGSALLLK